MKNVDTTASKKLADDFKKKNVRLTYEELRNLKDEWKGDYMAAVIDNSEDVQEYVV